MADLHSNVQHHQLGSLVAELENQQPKVLLDEIAERYVLPWSLVARVVGVSTAAVRKWRRGETVSPGYHQRIAELLAFCRLLGTRDARIDDIAHWLDMPVVARADVSRTDLLLRGLVVELLDVARGFSTGEELLDRVDPGWRDRATRAQRYRVLHHEDGTSTLTLDVGSGAE